MKKITEIKSAIEVWERKIKALDLAVQALESSVGVDHGAPLLTAIYDLADEYTKSVAEIVGDNGEWLEWYWYDNKFGECGFEAGPADDARKICSADGLAKLIRDCNEKC